MARKSLILLLATLTCYVESNIEDGPQVTINSGKVRGLVLKSYEGRDYHAYRAIPYAKSTAGLLRFKPPRPVDPWEGIFDGTQTGPVCPQPDMLTGKLIGTEDCLVINVYVPQLPKNDSEEPKPLPVMVWIHGGAFYMACGLHTFCGPEKMMDHPVIMVAFNYRLGFFGFLNTEDIHAPGNYGMLDQVLALKWVKQNIAYFGGDPKSITIFGISAGGASVVYHMLSPLSVGLFDNAIAQSGSPLNPWAFLKKPLDWAQRLASKIHCPSEVNEEMVECFRNQSAEALIYGSFQLTEVSIFPAYSAPSVDGPGGARFLPNDPLELMKKSKIASKVPFVAGILPHEGYMFYLNLVNKFKNEGQKFFDEDLPEMLLLTNGIETEKTEAIEAVRKEYFSNATLKDPKALKDSLLKMLTDSLFTAGISKTLDLFANADIPTLAYNYTHMGQNSLVSMHGDSPGKYFSHGDELMIQCTFLHPKMNEKDSEMSQLINSLWTTFAAGKELSFPKNPKSKEAFLWDLYDSNERHHLNLNLTPYMDKGKLCKNDDFWLETIPTLINATKERTNFSFASSTVSNIAKAMNDRDFREEF